MGGGEGLRGWVFGGGGERLRGWRLWEGEGLLEGIVDWKGRIVKEGWRLGRGEWLSKCGSWRKGVVAVMRGWKLGERQSAICVHCRHLRYILVCRRRFILATNENR